MFDVFKILGNLPTIKAKAPDMIGDFLDNVLKEDKKGLRPENGEAQIIFIAHPTNREGGGKSHEYKISVAALSEDDKILRILRTLTLTEALETILKNIDNVRQTI